LSPVFFIHFREGCLDAGAPLVFVIELWGILHGSAIGNPHSLEVAVETVSQEEFPKAKVQRCQVHIARNILAKVPKKFKQDMANDLRSIFYVPSQEKAWDVLKALGRDGKRAHRQRWTVWNAVSMPV
jgi:hypothetical protein